METIDYRTINEASVNDFYKMPYKIKCRGLIFKKEYNWYYSKNYSLDDIAAYGDTCEIIEWEEPEEDNKIEKIKDYSIMTTMGLDGKLQKRKISKAWKLEEIVNKINEIIDKVNGE